MIKGIHSLRQFITRLWLIISSLLILIIALYGYNSVRRYRENFQTANKIVVENYADQLNKDIKSAKSYIASVYSEDAHFQMLWKSNLTEMQWIRATYYLNNSLVGRAHIMDYVGGFFFYDGDKDTLRSSYSDLILYEDEYFINVSLKSYLRKWQGETQFEGNFEHDGEIYLLSLIGIRNKQVGFIINLDRYYTPENDAQIVIYEDFGEILVSIGSDILDMNAMRLLAENGENINMSYLSAIEKLDERNLSIAVVRQFDELYFWKSWELWLSVILIPLIAVIGLLIIYRILERALLQPVNHLMESITAKKKGNSHASIVEKRPDKIQEFRMINIRVDELVDELELLEQEKFKKEMAVNAALLQYYQLQMDQHFYLNCLNVLDSLLDHDNKYSIKSMINALAKHFRFVFQDSQKLVTVKEELEEIKSYCNICTIKKGEPIYLQIEAEESVLGFRIPILCIQTFLENSIKHAKKNDCILSVQVEISALQLEDKRYLGIRVTDNGDGYDLRKLADLNSPVTEFEYRSEHVGIYNLKHRIFLLYGEEAQVWFYNSPMGGAVAEILLPEESHNENLDH